jgi:putative ABC transport system permease protein
MNFVESTQVSLDGLRANKLRSFLTMLGVIIGVTAVILLVSLVLNAKQEIIGSIQGLGSNLFAILPGGKGPRRLGGRVAMQTLRLKHAQALAQRLTYQVVVSPELNRSAIVKYGSVTRQVVVAGALPTFPTARSWPIQEGRFLRKSDVDAKRRVCVIGTTIAKTLFPNVKALGQYLSIKGAKFQVVGILQSKGLMFDIDLDDQVLIPLTTAQQLFGTTYISLIFVQVPRVEEIGPAITQSVRILRQYLDEDEFSIKSQGEMLTVFQQVAGILTVLLGAIAGISLIVGGIGIMNIMIVSVTERTREIGIRKAVGAKDQDILLQFLNESIVLSVVGGLIGVLISYLVAAGLSLVYQTFFQLQISLTAVFTSLGFAAFIGVLSGVYPAYKAARLDPINALRYE